MATISKGITLSYKAKGASGTYTLLTNLQEIPELGGDTDAIEITVLSDDAHMYTNGIKSYGDSLSFKFLYDAEQFSTLNGFSGSYDWKVSLPDGEGGAIDTTCTFSGTSSVKLDGVGVNAALTYTLSVKPDSAMTWG